MSRLVGWWERYWFRPTPLFDLAVCRVLVVAFQLWYLLRGHYRRYLQELTGIDEALFDPLLIFRVLTLPLGWHGVESLKGGPWAYRPGFETLEVVYWITIVVGILALLGYRTQIALIVFAVTNLFLQAHAYSFGEIHHPEAVTMIVLFALAMSPSGSALSIDSIGRWLRRSRATGDVPAHTLTEERSTFARWPLLLTAWLFALVYFSAFYAKIDFAGFGWANGYTFQYYLIQDGLRWGRDLGVWLGGQHQLVVVMSWATLIWEGLFWLVLVRPPLAAIFVPVGMGFHTGAYLFMSAPFFHYFPLYAVFVPWSRMTDAVAARWAARTPERVMVLYDGHCPLCVRSMTVLRYTDWFRRLDLRDLERTPDVLSLRSGLSIEACRREMHVLTRGETFRGFLAFRRVLRELPPLWPLCLTLWLPLVDRLGPPLYAAVARRRTRLQCTPETCARHLT